MGLRPALRNFRSLVGAALAAALLSACSATKHVPAGQRLLDKVRISVADSSDVSPKDFYNYLRQTPNHRVLGLAKMQLGVYNLSGADSTRGFNRWLRKIGESPVIADSQLTSQSARQLRLALVNRGYNNARVEVDTTHIEEKRVSLDYKLFPGQPHRVNSITYDIPDPALRSLVMADSARFPVAPGDRLDRDQLDAQRALIAERLRNRGFYAFSKEYISFVADTVAGDKRVDLTMVLRPHRIGDPTGAAAATPDGRDRGYSRYRFRRVYVVTDFSPGDNTNDFHFPGRDTISSGGLDILYGPDRFLKPQAINDQCFIVPGAYYSSQAIDRTYEGFNRLAVLRYVNILTRPAPYDGESEGLDVYILLSRARKQGITAELEGTNSQGDLGIGGALTYTNRDLAHAGEILNVKVRGAYESLSGKLDNLINDRYTELAAEASLTFPKFKAPFIAADFKARMKASTEFALTFMRQERPEYTRLMFGAAWKYKWANRSNTARRTFDLVDINVVNLPKSTVNFIDHIAPSNPLLRYSYEDHFIMRMGYTVYITNRRPAATGLANARTRRQINTYTLRASGEMAGNLLYGISNLVGQRREGGVYRIFGIQYAQYIKGEFDYTINHAITTRNSISFHAGAGLAIPYGNSSMVPFEKRFFAGGANNVRGWGVRTLGPGTYDARNSVTDFINQCGDVSMVLNLEYRNKLFWVFEGALFVDAGNIWTIKEYPNQPGGAFRFNKFYKQIAAAYGIGLRMDFTYFLLRFDLGLKAHNPARDQEKWPLIHPSWRRDATFHFSVGYPF